MSPKPHPPGGQVLNTTKTCPKREKAGQTTIDDTTPLLSTTVLLTSGFLVVGLRQGQLEDGEGQAIPMTEIGGEGEKQSHDDEGDVDTFSAPSLSSSSSSLPAPPSLSPSASRSTSTYATVRDMKRLPTFITLLITIEEMGSFILIIKRYWYCDGHHAMCC